jgi:hypothetical protein
MNLTQRLSSAAQPAGIHLGVSILIAALAAWLVFAVWYPYPYRAISGGRELFTLLIVVDVIIGPALTLVLFNPNKARAELIRDLALVAALQVSALAYGMYSVHAARPVFMSFEGNRFRAVSAAEIDSQTLPEAQHGLGQFSHFGPITIAARLTKNTDPDFAKSIKQSMDGLHPSLRPSRWEPYDGHRQAVIAELKPLDALKKRPAEEVAQLDAAVAKAAVPAEQLGYLPLQSRTHSDWIVLVDRRNGDIRGFAAIDGW